MSPATAAPARPKKTHPKQARAPIRFPAGEGRAFGAELKKEVDAYFERTGESRYANFGMVLKALILFGLTFGAYGLLFTGWFSPLGMLGLCVAMGFGVAGIGFAVAHDALHGAYSRRGWINSLVGHSFDILGASGYLWQFSHNRIHHTWTNVPGADEDIIVSPLLRLSPDAQHRPVHKAQHIFAWFLYGLITLNWVVYKDWMQYFTKSYGPFENIRHPKWRFVQLVFWKMVNIGWMVVLPLMFLPITLPQFLLGYLTVHFVGGFVLSIVFQLAHVVEFAEYPRVSDEGKLPYGFHEHQLRTTANFAVENKFLTWYVGGLNHQIEHHLFPRICSRHYQALGPIVKRVAEKHGVPYHVEPTFRAGIRSHYRRLKNLGAGGAA